jgi:hypothetical protein
MTPGWGNDGAVEPDFALTMSEGGPVMEMTGIITLFVRRSGRCVTAERSWHLVRPLRECVLALLSRQSRWRRPGRAEVAAVRNRLSGRTQRAQVADEALLLRVVGRRRCFVAGLAVLWRASFVACRLRLCQRACGLTVHMLSGWARGARGAQAKLRLCRPVGADGRFKVRGKRRLDVWLDAVIIDYK